MVALKDFSWERMISAVEDVRERAVRAARALQQAGIPHVVVGGNAVAAWVVRVDREAVRNTKDVDLLVPRQDFERIIAELRASVSFTRTLRASICFWTGRKARCEVRSMSCLQGRRSDRIIFYRPPKSASARPGPTFPSLHWRLWFA